MSGFLVRRAITLTSPFSSSSFSPFSTPSLSLHLPPLSLPPFPSIFLSLSPSLPPASLSWRDMWALVTVKGGDPVGEDVGKAQDLQNWGLPVELHVTLPLQDSLVECDWPMTTENKLRRAFCSKYEGYGALCHCAKPLPLLVKSPPLSPNNVAGVPVTIIASNRPLYLFRYEQTRLISHQLAAPSLQIDRLLYSMF